MEKIVLASASPRRRELLSSIGLEFDVVESNFDESSVKRDCGPCNLARVLALEKAKDVYDRLDYGVVIGADTMVVLGNKIYGKPGGKKSAKKMLQSLSGKVHQVITGVAIIDRNGQVLLDCGVTNVYFNNLHEEDIDSYIKTEDYKGKAGAYGIQGKGAVLIKKIEGSYSNVVGLPLEVLSDMFRRIGDSIYTRWN